MNVCQSDRLGRCIAAPFTDRAGGVDAAAGGGIVVIAVGGIEFRAMGILSGAQAAVVPGVRWRGSLSRRTEVCHPSLLGHASSELATPVAVPPLSTLFVSRTLSVRTTARQRVRPGQPGRFGAGT